MGLILIKIPQDTIDKLIGWMTHPFGNQPRFDKILVNSLLTILKEKAFRKGKIKQEVFDFIEGMPSNDYYNKVYLIHMI